MSKKEKIYAYSIPSGLRGITGNWEACERIVKGVTGARFMAFSSKRDAERWLALGARYEPRPKKKLKPGIYFDAGTGRGNGVEISVTDASGKNLLHKAFPKKNINRFGKHLVTNKSATNNYGELLALRYALKIASKEGMKKIFGDSRLVIDYWSKWRIKRKKLPNETVDLANKVAEARKKFELKGGSVGLISGDDNPADLGFHR